MRQRLICSLAQKRSTRWIKLLEKRFYFCLTLFSSGRHIIVGNTRVFRGRNCDQRSNNSGAYWVFDVLHSSQLEMYLYDALLYYYLSREKQRFSSVVLSLPLIIRDLSVFFFGFCFEKIFHRPCVTYGKSENHMPQIITIPRAYGFQNFDTTFPSNVVFFQR